MSRTCFHRSLPRHASKRALVAAILGVAGVGLVAVPALAQATRQVPAQPMPAQAASMPQAAPSPAPAAAPARMETVTVALDHARLVKLPERTSTVIIGNPIIADVAVQKNGILVVTGKSYGQTNLIALDSNGQMLAESQIAVRQSLETIMTVQRGLDRESYSCTPHCQPSIQLGDAPKHFGEISGQAGARNSQATTAK